MTWIGALLLLTLSGCGAPAFQEYSSKEGRFKIQLPGNPEESSQKTTDAAELQTIRITASGSVYGVEWIDVAKDAVEDDAASQQRLVQFRKDCLLALNGQLISDRAIKLEDKYPGREFTADIPAKANLLTARCFLVDGRFYRVFALIPKSVKDTPEVSKVFDSFQILK